MLNTLVDLSLRYKLLTLVAFAVIAFLGWRAVNTVPIDAFPDLTPIQVNVYTESPGLAAEDVEELLTFPVESGMAGLTGVQQIRSSGLVGAFGATHGTGRRRRDVLGRQRKANTSTNRSAQVNWLRPRLPHRA